jgi:hypothetical protein
LAAESAHHRGSEDKHQPDWFMSENTRKANK